ncbi:hypothetical protein [Mycobacterium lepromatosis]|uniref:hypothetical protein n=1 Tax=Mycobacterium lepromatosis TaxID=480418 RepID=UPI000679B145|nr:hypothetical protein [Mycobacterium lepromatosis]
MWKVDQFYFDPRWIANKDPRADYVIARVSGAMESHVGSALSLGTAPALDSRVCVTGYPLAVGSIPIGCEARTGITESGFPSLACEGLVNGAPWVSSSAVIELVGGLQGGGCAQNRLYSAPFDEHTAQLLVRAQAGGFGDSTPCEFDDFCSGTAWSAAELVERTHLVHHL